MSDTSVITCPDCGATNPPQAESCSRCNFPLREPAIVGGAGPATPREKPTSAEDRPFDPGPRPRRPRRTRPDAMSPVQMQLWLFTGLAVVLGIVYFAVQGFRETNVKPVEGAQPEQQQRADLARKTLEKDSTNLAARIELANVMYDTGNWPEAIIHYKSAGRLDPKRPTTFVDMGVCYYSLGHFAQAESLFLHALTVDPKQPVAMFNLGVVAESRQQWVKALEYFHRAQQANPSEGMRQPLEEHIKAVSEKAGMAPTKPPGQGK